MLRNYDFIYRSVPRLRKALILGVIVTSLFVLLGGLGGTPLAVAGSIGGSPSAAAGTPDSEAAPPTWGCEVGVAECLAEVVYMFTVGIGSTIAYAAALFFNIAVSLSLQSTAYALNFITDGWTTVRDIANMFFVLILVYIALTIMFRANTHDTAKKLAWVIVIALIINFSFFLTRVVIDAGNLIAVQFYNAIPAQPLSESTDNNLIVGLAGEASKLIIDESNDSKDLTSAIMNGVGVHRVIGTEAFEAFKKDNSNIGGFFNILLTLSFLYIVVGAMFFMLAAAFFTVGIKFIVRIVVLWLVIIASPLALVANTLDEGKKYYQQWQDALIKHAFYPAVFLFIFWLLTQFMNNLTDGGTLVEKAFGDLSTVEGGGLSYLAPLTATIAIRLGFVIALLYVGLQVSEKMGVAGSKLAQSASKRIPFMGGLNSYKNYGGYFGRPALRATGAAIGRPIGKGAIELNSTLKKVRWANQETMLGRLSTSFRQGVLEPASKTSIFGAKSQKDVEDRRKKEAAERKANLRDVENKALVDRMLPGAPLAAADKVRLEGLTVREFESMGADRVSKIMANAALRFSNDRIRQILKSEKFDDKQKADIQAAWTGPGARMAPLTREAMEAKNRVTAQQLRERNGRGETRTTPAERAAAEKASTAAHVAGILQLAQQKGARPAMAGAGAGGSVSAPIWVRDRVKGSGEVQRAQQQAGGGTVPTAPISALASSVSRAGRGGFTPLESVGAQAEHASVESSLRGVTQHLTEQLKPLVKEQQKVGESIRHAIETTSKEQAGAVKESSKSLLETLRKSEHKTERHNRELDAETRKGTTEIVHGLEKIREGQENTPLHTASGSAPQHSPSPTTPPTITPRSIPKPPPPTTPINPSPKPPEEHK